MEWKESLYVVFRVFVGLLFAGHGAMELFGLFGNTPMEQFSFMWFIGSLELLSGLAIAVGFLTRIASLIGIVIMIGAQAKVHLAKGLIPYTNGGELAMLYLLAFLVILAYGGRKLALKDSITGFV